MAARPRPKGKKKKPKLKPKPKSKPKKLPPRKIKARPRKMASHTMTWASIVGKINAGLDFVLEKGKRGSEMRVTDVVSEKYLGAVVKRRTGSKVNIMKSFGKTAITDKAVNETRKLIVALDAAAQKGKKVKWG